MDSASASASANAANQTGPPISYLRPLMISMFGVVLTAIAILLYHFILAGVCKRRRMEAEAAMRSSSGQPIAGVDKKVLERIPIIKFSALTEGMDQEAECVVCLGEMEIEEMVRVLPTCRHAFHVACVDEWLAGHVTCPLCRSPIEPGAGFDPKLFIPQNGSGGAALPLGVILPTERSGRGPAAVGAIAVDRSIDDRRFGARRLPLAIEREAEEERVYCIDFIKRNGAPSGQVDPELFAVARGEGTHVAILKKKKEQ